MSETYRPHNDLAHFCNCAHTALGIPSPAQVSHQRSVTGRIAQIEDRISEAESAGRFKVFVSENETPEVLAYFASRGYGYTAPHLTW